MDVMGGGSPFRSTKGDVAKISIQSTILHTTLVECKRTMLVSTVYSALCTIDALS
jgi:hypothetical protein